MVEAVKVVEAAEVDGVLLKVEGSEGGAAGARDGSVSHVGKGSCKDAHDDDAVEELAKVKQIENADELVRCGQRRGQPRRKGGRQRRGCTVTSVAQRRNVPHAGLDLTHKKILRLVKVENLGEKKAG